MKILQVSTHLNIGGIANYILSLSSALKQKGVDVIVASAGGDLDSEFGRIGIIPRRIDIKTKFELSPKVLKSAISLSGIIKKDRVDIMHAHTRVSQVTASIASYFTGIPYVTTCHGFFKKRLRGVFDTWGEGVIAISDAVRKHLAEDLGVSEKRIELIYSGVDADKFSKDYSADDIKDIKIALGLKDGPVIGTIGRLSPVKGHRFLVQAMKEVVSRRKDAQMVIVGDGGEKGALQDLAGSLGIAGSVHFFNSALDTHKFLSVMDVFVFPSVKEGLGIALLEAMASGVPCVASDIGGIGDIIKSGFNGMLVGVGDTPAISEAVSSLLDSAALRANLGSNARALVRQKFSLSSMADKVIGFYVEVMRGRRRA